MYRDYRKSISRMRQSDMCEVNLYFLVHTVVFAVGGNGSIDWSGSSRICKLLYTENCVDVMPDTLCKRLRRMRGMDVWI